MIDRIFGYGSLAREPQIDRVLIRAIFKSASSQFVSNPIPAPRCGGAARYPSIT